jgi:hypothetical protein
MGELCPPLAKHNAGGKLACLTRGHVLALHFHLCDNPGKPRLPEKNDRKRTHLTTGSWARLLLHVLSENGYTERLFLAAAGKLPSGCSRCYGRHTIWEHWTAAWRTGPWEHGHELLHHTPTARVGWLSRGRGIKPWRMRGYSRNRNAPKPRQALGW